MKIGIVGAGVTGLSAAFDLLKQGHDVTLFEADDKTGGLATGFQDAAWEWPLEKFYHHLFKSDKAIIQLTEEIGMRDKLFFRRPITSVMYRDQIVPFDSPKSWITFPGFNVLDVARFGLISSYLRFTKPWRTLERFTADNWLRRWYGDGIYETVWRPLLIGKFGPYFQQANMAWMWARLHVRSPKLGYFVGGFQAFVDRLTEEVKVKGARVELNCPVHGIVRLPEAGYAIKLTDRREQVDICLVTTSPKLLSTMAVDLPTGYVRELLQMKSMGAVVLTLALNQPLMHKSGTYWLNIPATSPEKVSSDIPFLALVEHTNYIDRKFYGGDHIIYCGDYVLPSHPYFEMSSEAVESRFVSALTKINPEFKPDWVRKSWLWRAHYAQPVPFVDHSRHVPDLATPLSGLYFASMSQVYPWDRGTNYAVAIGRQVARRILEG
jgi:protoporphyrinogen oxidase